ncbi:MAG: ABC transporter ATP-binding protein [Ilumatobacteraceae bacterium]
MTVANSIEARDLIVDYTSAAGTVRALECPTFAVEGGSNIAVMGPSGCGKSTLLGVLAGLARPTSGTVEIGDETISTLPERERVRFRRRCLGMVYQADNLLSHLTVEENLGLQLAICRHDMNTRQPIAPGELLERLGLASLSKRLPDHLSGGQRQRVAVARAVIHRPAVIFADEPTGALDAESAQTVIELLVDVHREMAATLVLVTHDPNMAHRLQRVVTLSRSPAASERPRAG